MITTEQKYAVVDEYKPHTESVVKSTQKQFLPVFSTGKIFVTDRYHYMDREYGFAYSAEEPEIILKKIASVIYCKYGKNDLW